MKHWRIWLGVAVVLGLTAVTGYFYWDLNVRYRPRALTHSPLEIARTLERAGWVSPGLRGRVLYMVSFRTCPDCERFQRTAFARLHRAGVDTRVIVVARADSRGISHSTPAERTTVAELWANRSWALFQRWEATPPATWTAPGLIPADTDTSRTAIVEAGRQMIETLRPLLAENGISFAYPLLAWQSADGTWRACACESPRTYGYVLRDLGVER
jgi:hypothetical protein